MPSLNTLELALVQARIEGYEKGYVHGYQQGEDDMAASVGEKAARLAENQDAPGVAESIRNMVALFQEMRP